MNATETMAASVMEAIVSSFASYLCTVVLID